MKCITITRAIVIILFHLVHVGRTQLEFMTVLDPSWVEQIQKIVHNVRRLELDSLYFKLPFENKNITQVQFHLYTRTNPHRGQLLQPSDSASFQDSNFDRGHPTKILVHGYSQTSTSFDFPRQIRDAYLNRELNASYNVICVDWSALSKEINYFDSANYTIHVGEYIAQFIIEMKSMGYISRYEELHVVGFSLGAHVAGVIGHHIAEETRNSSKIGRLTGLDPAQPGFLYAPEMHRLDSQDAHFVDIIHTNAGVSFGYLGMVLSSGHADFYPNGGRKQPSCEFSLFTEYSIPRRSTCSHVKAADYFAKSILGQRYVGCGCRDWDSFRRGVCDCTGADGQNREERDMGIESVEVEVLMGEHCSSKARGEFYLVAR